MNFQHNKTLFLICGVLLLIVSGMLVWYFFPIEKKGEEKAPEKVKNEQKLKHLQELDEQILSTQKQLEKIETLSPEERKKREKEREILSAQRVTKDVLLEGVEITLSGGKKVITNRAQGYRIEVPSNLIIARSIASDWIELHDSQSMCQDPACDPVIKITVAEANPALLSLEDWFNQEENKARAPIFSPREQLSINGQKTYRVLEVIPGKFDGFSYYWEKGKKIYTLRISSFDEPTYRNAINTFSLDL